MLIGDNMTKNKLIAKTATEALRVLWSENFFKKWRKISDISSNLANRHHHFSTAELGMALNRAKHLTRRGKKRCYEYIQKHPFMEVDEHERSGRNK
jgi:hypothetical protein